jgi:polar amino acid transport system substrate-binding protein
MRVGTKLAAAAVGSVLLVTTAACGSDTSSTGGDGARKGSIDIGQVKADPAVEKLVPADVKKRGSLTMAADLHYPPTSFLAEDNKTPIGYNVEIAQLLGKKMGLKIKIKNVSFDSVIPGISAGRYDFTATNMTPTPERLQVLDMVKYWSDGSSVVVSKGNPQKFTMAGDYQSFCGRKMAVITGTTQQETYVPQISAACKANGKPAIDSVVLPNVQAALTQLSSKRIEAVFYDTPSLAWAAKQQPQAFELLPKQYVKKEGDNIVALGLDKGSPLTPALHAAMQSLIDGPEYKATLDKWGLGSGAIPSASVAK